MIKNVKIQNFRRHKEFKADLKDESIIITGANGSGKTSIIEAIYIALNGRSWRSGFQEILREENDSTSSWWRVDIKLSDGESRTIKFVDNQKVFEINNQKFTRLPARHKKPVILFEPNDLQLLYGSPARRRDFFDRFITQIETSHQASLNKFSRILKQRNNLLKKGALANELFVWDMQFAELAEKIIMTRENWINKINKEITVEYQSISTKLDGVSVKYSTPQKSKQQILNQLSVDYSSNCTVTKIGPQTHDVKLKINNHNAKLTASRGESRTIIFAILATMTKLLNQELSEKVYLVFDDIDSELDFERKAGVYKSQAFKENYLFATTIESTDSAINLK